MTIVKCSKCGLVADLTVELRDIRCPDCGEICKKWKSKLSFGKVWDILSIGQRHDIVKGYFDRKTSIFYAYQNWDVFESVTKVELINIIKNHEFAKKQPFIGVSNLTIDKVYELIENFPDADWSSATHLVSKVHPNDDVIKDMLEVVFNELLMRGKSATRVQTGDVTIYGTNIYNNTILVEVFSSRGKWTYTFGGLYGLRRNHFSFMAYDENNETGVSEIYADLSSFMEARNGRKKT